jgi:hypothetical protein
MLLDSFEHYEKVEAVVYTGQRMMGLG